MSRQKTLYKYLAKEIFPQLAPPPYGDIEIIPLQSTKPVYLFLEKGRGLSAIGKSFEYGQVPPEHAWSSAQREFSNLKLAREKFGMGDTHYQIIAPLGENKELSALVVTRKAGGNLLDHYIARAIYDQRRQKLFDKLGCLAKFFARLHGNTRTSQAVSSSTPQRYLDRLLASLEESPLDRHSREAIDNHAAGWWQKKEVFSQDSEVLVHGDATPTNFFLHHEKVVGIDVERMRYADRCWDLGFLAAELKHHFMWRTGDGWAAEPFIGHFLWEYALSSYGSGFFHTITRKLPLYMALGLLRIGRNRWLDANYRKILFEEAKRCLEFGL